MSADDRWAGWLEVAARPPLPELPLTALSGGPPALADRVVLITGGSSGLGRSLIELCLGEGARVSTLSRRPVEDVTDERFSSVIGDLARPGERAAWVAGVLERWGRIDGLINNAALVDGDPGAADLRQLFEVNVAAPDDLIRRVVPAMKEAGCGRIINVTSDLSMMAAPARLAGYAATKAALNSLTRSWASALRGTGVLVNGLHPGHFRSRLNPTAGFTPKIVWAMTMMMLACGDDGPTGRFFTDRRELAWYR